MALRQQRRVLSVLKRRLFAQQRRRLKPVFFFVVVCLPVLFFVYRTYNQLTELTSPTTTPPQQILLKDSQGRIISRNSSSLWQFLDSPYSVATEQSNMTMPQAMQGREPIIAILKDAGIFEANVNDILKLPKWSQVTDLYGKDPVVLGLEKCKEFRRRVPLEARYIGVAGMFNSGTTAFGLSLQANCRFPNHKFNRTNDVVTDVNGILNQVPWAKHKPARSKNDHTIHPNITKDNVLPVVLVRDPYYWMHSMCKQGYGVRWDHNEKHCPNLIPNDFDRQRFKRLRHAESVPVWMGRSPKTGPTWKSLTHYWNDWYESYLGVDFPRLVIRFEDTLFHGKQVMDLVCQCGGAQQAASHFTYLVDEAKWNHKHAQNNMLSAMMKYGTDAGRYRNMTDDDLRFAHDTLNMSLMETFKYQLHASD
jgi:hypothetical protein